MMQIEEVEHINTLFSVMPDGSKVASIILPSSMDAVSALNHCSVDFQTGELIPRSDTEFITDATVTEMNDTVFRVACNSNKKYFNSLSFKNPTTASFTLKIKEWKNKLPKQYKKCRLYGGDLLTTDMLRCFCEAFSKDKNHTFYIHTSRWDILNDINQTEVPSNLFLYAVNPIKNSAVTSLNYPTFSYTNNADTDLNTYPTGKLEKINIAIGHENANYLRTKKPWWQSIL